MILATGGCWDAMDIEDRDISTAVVVDYRDGEYSFYVEIAAITSKVQNMKSEQGSADGLNTNTIKASGKTLAEARLELDALLNKPIFLGAVQALILTESMADNGITEYAYRVRQMIDYRKIMDVVVTPDNPEDFLGVVPSNESTVGFAIEDTLDTLIDLGSTFHMSIADLLEKLASQNPAYLISTLSVVNGQIKLVGYTVFEGGYRVGSIPYEDSQGIVYIMLGQAKGTPKFDYVVPVGEGRITTDTALVSMDITPRYEDGIVKFQLDMCFEGMPLYPSDNIVLSSEVKEEYREALTRQLYEEIYQTVALSQEYDCDYLSFSETFRIRYPDIFAEMNWADEFKKAEFSISVSAEIVSNPAVDYTPYD